MNANEAPPITRGFFIAIGAIAIAYHLGLIFWGLVPNLVSRPMHMAIAIPVVLVLMAKPGWPRWTGIALCVAGLICCGYVALNERALGDQYGYLQPNQLALAVILLICVLEMARRAIGWPLPIIAALALEYSGVLDYSATPRTR